MAELPSSLDVQVSVNADLALAQVRCMGAYLVAATPIERRIEMAALEALCEIQRAGERARRDLGVAADHRIRLEIDLHQPDAFKTAPRFEDLRKVY